MKTLRIRMNDVHNNAKAHGWWDDCTTLEERRAKIPEKILLVHCELSEAVEEFRTGNVAMYYDKEKPEGVFVELADAIIRILDLAGACDVDIEHILELKHQYNLKRPYRHGNKVI